MAAAAAAAPVSHDITVTTAFRGTDGLIDADLPKALACDELQRSAADVKAKLVTELQVVAKFTALKTKYCIDFEYKTADPDVINVNIYGKPGSRASGPVIVCQIHKTPGEWDNLEVTDFVIDVWSEAKDDFKQNKKWPGFGPRGFLVIQWIAYNFGCKKIELEDAWTRWVPNAPDDVYRDDFVRDHDLSMFRGKPAITRREYSEVIRLLKRRDAGEDVDAELAATAYGTDAKDRFDTEYTRAVADGTVDAAEQIGYYGLFNFAQRAGKIMEQDVLKVKGTRLRTTNRARWVVYE